MSPSRTYCGRNDNWQLWSALVIAASFLVAGAAVAEDAPAPLVTPENAAQHADQNVLVELSVIEVKFARRRQFHFLSGSANFRAENNIPVTIRAGDVERFERAGIKDLSAKYAGQKIRAQGKLIRDESQWLVVVSSPEQIEIVGAQGKPAATANFTIIDEQGSRIVLSLTAADGLARSSITLDHEGNQETYEGITLADLLGKAKVTLGANARGSQLGRYLIVSGADGYASVFSLAEIDPYYTDRPAMLVDKLNGQPLVANRGPVRIIVPADKHRRRWVGQVTEIEVRNALDNAATSEAK